MGFLDSFGGHSGIASGLLGLLAQEGGHTDDPNAVHDDPGALTGGLGELVNRFKDSGYGDVAQSWMSGGGNSPISPDIVHQVLGSEFVDKLADHIGIPKDQLLGTLSSFLPGMVDKMTPDSRLPEEHEIET
jgi:uncharacterized protein YidB (DUF937 family)